MKILRSVRIRVEAPFSGGFVLLKIGDVEILPRIFLMAIREPVAGPRKGYIHQTEEIDIPLEGELDWVIQGEPEENIKVEPYIWDNEKVDEPIMYSGHRDGDGAGAQPVLRDGLFLSPLPSQKIWNHSPDGFNWGYNGSGPAQLALALLYDVFPDRDICLRFHQAFKRDHVANFSSVWEITDIEIRNWLTKAISKDAY